MVMFMPLSRPPLQCQQDLTRANISLEGEFAKSQQRTGTHHNTEFTIKSTSTQQQQQQQKFYLVKPIWPNGNVTDVRGKLGSTSAVHSRH